jgi:hypothetical protein
LLGFHWIKARFNETGRRWLQKQADKWGVPVFLGALLLSAFYVVVPETYPQVARPTTTTPEKHEQPSTPDNKPITEQPNSGAHRFYSAAEKEELANRIAAIYQILNSEMLELGEQWLAARSHDLGSKSDTEQFLKEIDALKRARLQIAISNFRDGVTLYFLTYDYLTPILRAQFVQILRPFQGALFETASDLKKWVYQTNDRIAERRKSL